MADKQSYRQGIYNIKNREKYLGIKPAIFRSSWEYTYMRYLDNNIHVKGWCCECVVIPYSFNGKTHRYFPDFLVIWDDGKKEVIEIKPLRETKPPINTKKKSQSTLLYEHLTYKKNKAKWEAAIGFCLIKKMEFRILTEKQIK